MKKTFFLWFTFIFCAYSLHANEGMPKRIFTYISIDSTDGYGNQAKRTFIDRTSTFVNTGASLSFLVGQDASTVKSGLKDDLGRAGVFPRVGFFIRSVTNINLVRRFDLVIGIGYDMRGWWERHTTADVRTLNGINSNSVYVRTDYANLYLGGMYRPVDWFGIRTGLDLGFLLYAYGRTGKFISSSFVDFFGIPRSLAKTVLPSVDLGLSFGKSDGLKLGIDLQYSANVFHNLDYRYFMLKVGINYSFMRVIPQQNSL